MESYIYLDTWVFSLRTDPPDFSRLSRFIGEADLTILVDSLTLTELYNPSHTYSANDRAVAASQLLGLHPSAIVEPLDVILAELYAYPRQLPALPISLSSTEVASHLRGEAILMFLRRDPVFLALGKDVAEWAAQYADEKASWLGSVDAIIDHASSTNLLAKRPDGTIDPALSNKEGFLQYLDRRYLRPEYHGAASQEERASLTAHIAELALGATAALPALRLTSLMFWFAYVDVEQSSRTRKADSDIGDIYKAALAPYCTFFTTDKTMARILARATQNLALNTSFLGPRDLTSLMEPPRSPV